MQRETVSRKASIASRGGCTLRFAGEGRPPLHCRRGSPPATVPPSGADSAPVFPSPSEGEGAGEGANQHERPVGKPGEPLFAHPEACHAAESPLALTLSPSGAREWSRLSAPEPFALRGRSSFVAALLRRCEVARKRAEDVRGRCSGWSVWGCTPVDMLPAGPGGRPRPASRHFQLRAGGAQRSLGPEQVGRSCAARAWGRPGGLPHARASASGRRRTLAL